MFFRSAGVMGVVLLLVALATPVGAEIVGEGVTALRCAEGDDLTMPKKMEFMQTVLTDDFEDYDQVVLLAEAEYAEAPNVNQGQIIATVFLIKPDSTQTKLSTKLGKLKAKMLDGDAFRLKVVNAHVERGDFLLWKVKTRGLPPLLAELEDCLNFYFVLARADEPVE